jgi:hypothetical protein
MPSDRYTKFVLTIIAMALCAMALPRLETPEVMAASGQAEAMAAVAPQQSGQAVNSVSSTANESSTMARASTKPLRWRVMNAFHDADSNNSICGTVVTVRNLAPVTVSVDVQWFNNLGFSEGLSTQSISPTAPRAFWTNNNVNLAPFSLQGTVTLTSDFSGWANVHADDPRILASAAIVCRDVAGTGASNIEAMVDVATFPVGATMEFFQAGMPASWVPPVAVSEMPE